MRSRRKIKPSSIEMEEWAAGPEVHISISTAATVRWPRRKDVKKLAEQLRGSGTCLEVTETMLLERDRHVLINAVIRNDGRRAKRLSIIKNRIGSCCLLMMPGRNEPIIHQEETLRRSRRDYVPVRRVALVRS